MRSLVRDCLAIASSPAGTSDVHRWCYRRFADSVRYRNLAHSVSIYLLSELQHIAVIVIDGKFPHSVLEVFDAVADLGFVL